MTRAVMGVAFAAAWLLVGGAQGADRLDGMDKTFVEKAARGGLLEVRLGELARKQGASEDVRKFGEQMVTDHGKVNEELKQLATRKQVTLPKELDEQGTKEVARLSKLSGSEFDREYIAFMVRDHTEDVREFERYAKDGKDEDVKAFARRTLPALERHLRMAKDIQAKLK